MKFFRQSHWKKQEGVDAASGRPAGRLSSNKGQTAVILILLAAIGLIFLTITYNFGRLSQIKTLTMTAANSSAGTMASLAASYGEQLFQETMGGKIKECKHTSVLEAFLIFIVIVIALIITIIAVGTTTAIVIAIIGVVLSAVSLTLQITVVQPTLTSMWNRMMKSLPVPDQFIEFGMQTAQQGVITDQVQVPDYFDIDQDGKFGPPLVDGQIDTAPDTISRFAYLQTMRLQKIPSGVDPAYQNFLDGLEDLLYTDGTVDGSNVPDFGLTDPLDCAVNGAHACCAADKTTVPAVCDPCCVDPGVYGDGNLPDCCTSIIDKCGDPTTCASRSPFPTPGAQYPLIGQARSTDDGSITHYIDVYANKYNIPGNAVDGTYIRSFREDLGTDDEHHLYTVNRSAPGLTDAQIYQSNVANQGFFLEDSAGYYGSYSKKIDASDQTVFSPPNDPRFGMFPFFYKIKDWGVELGSSSFNYQGVQCFWCDSTDPTNGTCSVTLPAEVPQLALPDTTPPAYSGGLCVDKANSGNAGDLPWIADNVPGIPEIFSDTKTGGSSTACPAGPNGVGGWRPGADQYCSTTWPYYAGCAKNGNTCTVDDLEGGTISVDCDCGDGNAQSGGKWVDDNLDRMVMEIEDLLRFGRVLINAGAKQLQKQFVDLYPEIADWIEPYCPDIWGCPGSFTKLQRWGRLYLWQQQLQSYVDPIKDWVTPPSGSEYVGANCAGPSSIWCIPPDGGGVNNEYGINECSGVPSAEAATFDVNSNGTRGDLEDVVACLDWNANNTVSYPADSTSATGNAAKFQACYDACFSSAGSIAEKCTSLPRSLVPGFAANYLPFFPGYDVSLYDTCLAASDYDACTSACDPTTVNFPAIPGNPLPGSFTAPAAQSFFNTMATTQNDCANNNITQWDPDTVCCSGHGLTPGTAKTCASTTAADWTTCQNSCENDCSGGWTFSTGQAPTTLYDAILAARNAGASAASTCSTAGFQADLQASINAAGNQVVKFKKRYDFLKNRLDEAAHIETTFQTAIDNLTAFLNGGDGMANINSPAEELIDARINLKDHNPNVTPSVNVYVWQDERTERQKRYTEDGYWHAVKVEVRMPGRCGGPCGGANGLPTIRTSHSTFSRCYWIENTTGLVKAKVIRWDEDRMPHRKSFLGGTPIWEMKYAHPEKGPATEADIDNVDAACFNTNKVMDPRLFNQPWGKAVMLGKDPHEGDADYDTCWNAVHEHMLPYGVESNSCARYYGDNSGFKLKFVPCDKPFLRGEN